MSLQDSVPILWTHMSLEDIAPIQWTHMSLEDIAPILWTHLSLGDIAPILLTPMMSLQDSPPILWHTRWIHASATFLLAFAMTLCLSPRVWPCCSSPLPAASCFFWFFEPLSLFWGATSWLAMFPLCPWSRLDSCGSHGQTECKHQVISVTDCSSCVCPCKRTIKLI